MPKVNSRDNENNRWKRMGKKQRPKKEKNQRSVASYSDIMRAKWFCCTLKLRLVQ